MQDIAQASPSDFVSFRRKADTPSDTIESFLARPVKWGPIGEEVYKRTYSQDTSHGKETWAETVVRVVDGNLGLVDARFIEANERELLIKLLFDMGALPAGRHLSASGRIGRQFLFNCHNSHYDIADPSAHFTFLFDQLMQGGGVGANYSNRYMEDMPVVKRQIHLHIVCDSDHPNIGEFSHLLSEHHGLRVDHDFVVPDSREGWVDAVGVILRLAFGETAGFAELDPKASEAVLTINVSGIRARGLPLKTSGGIACGPGPLIETLVAIAKRVNGCYGRRLNTLDTMAVDHDLAACVIAGGKRRSSRMSVKNWKDSDIFEFINCKSMDGLHWSTNISVETDDEYLAAYSDQSHEWHSHARRVARAIVLGKRENGEPGLWNISLARKNDPDVVSPNPCGEIGLVPFENCLTGDSLVLTTEGYRSIASLVGQKVTVISALASDEVTSRDAGGGTFAASVFSTGTQAVRKITTVDGRIVRATDEHPFLVETDTGRYWITTKDLKVGDHLVASQQTAMATPTSVDEKMYALGHFLGDGWFLRTNGKLSMGICAGQEDAGLLSALVPVWASLISTSDAWIEGARDNCYSHDLHITKSERNGVASMCFYKPHLARRLEQEFGFVATTAPNKRFPTAYWAWNQNQKASFLRGLLDADGTVHNGQRALAHLSCANPDFGRDFMAALSEFGIVGRMTVQTPRAGRTQCCVMMRGQDTLARLFEVVYKAESPFMSRKRDMLQTVLETRGLRRSSDLLEILSIEDDGEEETFNMEVQTSHNFVVNGVVTHNCNLGHINMEYFAPNPSGYRPVTTMREAFRLMARWLVRATFGDIPQPRQRKVVDKNRRIGVGFFGYHAWLALHGTRYSEGYKTPWVVNTLRDMKQVVVESASSYAQKLEIPVPVKNTTLAPTGTIVNMPGGTPSGQCMMSPWFKRLVRYSDMDTGLDKLRADGIEVFPDDDARNTSIAVFWCEDPLVAKVRAIGFDPADVLESQYDISMEDSLATQAMFQDVYVDNAVSFTINLRPEDMPNEEAMEGLLMKYLPRLKGTTVFPEKSRKNTPIQPITKAQFDAHLGPKQVTNVEVECVGGCPVK